MQLTVVPSILRGAVTVVVMSNYESKARDMVAKAEKKLKGYSFLGGMGAKYDDAAELLESAGNNFKLAKACEWKF